MTPNERKKRIEAIRKQFGKLKVELRLIGEYPMSCKNGGTHHHACECREKQFAELRAADEAEIRLLQSKLDEAIAALKELEKAEQTYRLNHDTKGDSSLDSGRAWDHMRHAGNKARALLKKWGIE